MAKQSDVCRYFLQGKCIYGNKCRFSHPPNRGGHANRFDNGRNWDRMEGGNPYNEEVFVRGSIGSTNWRGGGGTNWRGGRGGGNNWRGGGGGGGSNWRGGGGGNNWRDSGVGGSNWIGGGGGGNNWRGGGGGGNNWRGAGGRGNNWRGAGDGNNWRGSGGGGNNWRGGSGGGNYWRGGSGGGHNWRGGGGGGGGGGGHNWRGGGGGGGHNWRGGGGGGYNWRGGNEPIWRGGRDANWKQGSQQSNNEFDMSVDDNTVPTADRIVIIIREDLSVWERSGLWPLSCYTPFHMCPNLPDFEDYSMEEIRYLAYLSTDDLQHYLDTFRKLYEQQKLLWNHYQSITPQDVTQFVTGRQTISSSLYEKTPATYKNPFHTTTTFTPVKDLFGVKEMKHHQSLALSTPSATTHKLTQAEIDIFNAPQFSAGQVPETPPTDDLCK